MPCPHEIFGPPPPTNRRPPPLPVINDSSLIIMSCLVHHNDVLKLWIECTRSLSPDHLCVIVRGMTIHSYLARLHYRVRTDCTDFICVLSTDANFLHTLEVLQMGNLSNPSTKPFYQRVHLGVFHLRYTNWSTQHLNRLQTQTNILDW